MTGTRHVVVLGGSSLVAPYLLTRLAGRFETIEIVARRPVVVPAGAEYLGFGPFEACWTATRPTTVISLLPLPALVSLLDRLVEVQSVIALSSTRRFSNIASADADERASAEALVTAERDLAAWSEAGGVRLTVLRPTLIYDMVHDLNLARMARFVRRFRILPVASPACGLRQPIHADDVAKAIVGALDNEAAADGMFNIAGGERLTYRAMAERVIRGVGLTPRFLVLPTGPLRLAFEIAGRAGLIHGASSKLAMLQRMNEDLVFDVDDGLRVLAYAPRAFDPSQKPAP